MKRFSISNLSDNKHTFVIAEAGSNWKADKYDDDLKRAKQLIDVAVESGADAVKFQTFRSNTVYAQSAGKSKYLSENGVDQNINDIFDHLSMPYEMIPELADYCKKKNILFMSSPFSIQDAKQIDPYVELHKVASYEINHVRLLEYLAKTRKPIIISTGASTYQEIDFAIDLLKKSGNGEIALLQCTAKYPAPLNSLNLLAIQKIKTKYNVPVGLSDHSIDPVVGPLLAIGLGATIIEKHFTLDNSFSGPDHKFALNPQNLTLMVNSIRQSDLAKGDGIKRVLDEEVELRYYATRSIQAIKQIKKGEVLKEGINFEVLRPGNNIRGVDARFLNIINGKKAKKDIAIGEGIIDYE